MEQERYYITSHDHSIRQRISKQKGKVYDLVFRVITIDGDIKQKWLRGYKTKALAEAAYMQFVQDCCTFTISNPKKKKDKAKEVLLVGDLIRQYLATLGNQNKQSVIYDKENIFKLFILSKYDKTPIDELTKEELTIWQDDLWATKNAKTGKYFAHRYLTKIRGYFSVFLTWVEERYEYTNHFKKIKVPQRRQPKVEMKFWTREQFASFLAVVDNDTYRALFTFLFYTGRRKGEVFALSPGDVKKDTVRFDKSVNRRTFRTGTWEITSTKEEKTCTIPVCNPVQEVIAWYKPPKGAKFYFGGNEPLAPTTVDRYFKKYTKSAGLPEIRLHDLRHSFVSMLIHKGANYNIIADLISDTVEMVMKTYSHFYIEDKMQVLALI